jgi:hypothetical protein
MAATLKLGDRKWATKEGSLLAYNDENNNYKPLPFDFTRASSATRVNKQGLIETVASGVPRIDFTDANGALKLEPQRTNLVTYSESFSGWGFESPIALTSNSTTSPDGTQNAAKIEYNGSAGGTYFRTTYTAAVGVFSIYAKKGNWRYLGIRNNGGGSHSVWDFDTETFSNVQTNHTMSFDALGNGWYRIMDYVSVDTAGPHRGVAITDTTGTEASPSAPAGSYVYLWGAQGENSTTYATSYIPTQGSAVTRIADACSQTVPDGIIGQTEGTVFLDFKPQTLDATSRYLSIENSSSASNGWMGIFAALSSGDIRFRFYGDGWDFSSTLIVEKNTRYKIAFSYKNGVQTSVYVNGNLIGNLTASLSGKSFQKIKLSEAAFGVRGDADFKDIKLYNTRLTDAELIALTT